MNARYCGACNGEGAIQEISPWGDSHTYPCPDCGGNGIVDEEWLADA